jgi:hypothetical protein
MFIRSLTTAVLGSTPLFGSIPSIIAAGCNHRCFQTSPSGLDQIAPMSVVSSNPTLVAIAAGAAVSEFVDAVAPADRTLLEAGCVM